MVLAILYARDHHLSPVEVVGDNVPERLAAAPATSLALFVAGLSCTATSFFLGTAMTVLATGATRSTSWEDVVATPCDEVAIGVLVAFGVLVEVVVATIMATIGPLPPPPPPPD